MSGAGTSWVNVEPRNGQLGAEYRRWGSLLVKVNRWDHNASEGKVGPVDQYRGLERPTGVGTSVVLNKPETRFGGHEIRGSVKVFSLVRKFEFRFHRVRSPQSEFNSRRFVGQTPKHHIGLDRGDVCGNATCCETTAAVEVGRNQFM